MKKSDDRRNDFSDIGFALTRSSSLTAAERKIGRRIFVLPPKGPSDTNRIYSRQQLVSWVDLSGIYNLSPNPDDQFAKVFYP